MSDITDDELRLRDLLHEAYWLMDQISTLTLTYRTLYDRAQKWKNRARKDGFIYDSQEEQPCQP